MEHAADWFIGLATVLLVIATGFLWKATKLLADAAREDSRGRKIQATVDAWMRLRPQLDLKDLREQPKDAIERAGERLVPQLRYLEAYAACVNSGVYDVATFNRISGAWFIQHLGWIKPYISLKREGAKNPPYQELIELEGAIHALRRSLQGQHASPQISN